MGEAHVSSTRKQSIPARQRRTGNRTGVHVRPQYLRKRRHPGTTVAAREHEIAFLSVMQIARASCMWFPVIDQ